MPEAEIARTVQLLDLMLDFFAHDGHWTRGSYDDGNGGILKSDASCPLEGDTGLQLTEIQAVDFLHLAHPA